MSVTLPETEHSLELREAVSVGSDSVRADGTVAIHVIRPGVGRGKGRHLYEERMLRENAGVFSGWKMFIDHQSKEAKRRQGGLPRSLREVGGIITESYWDENVPADPENGFGRGAVIGICKPVPLVRELIQTDPAIVEASINATATGVKPVDRDGQQVWLVEGIQPRGTVDWVTEAGAGGRVVSLMEATMEETLEEARAIEAELLAEMDDSEIEGYLRANRPQLLEALSVDGEGEGNEGGQVDTPTPEQLREALETDEGREIVSQLVEARLGDSVATLVTEQLGDVEALVESRVREQMDEEREVVRAEASAEARRDVELRDLRETAHRLIGEAKLPEAWERDVRARFDITESGPTPLLDVIPEIDGEGNVVKPATDVLAENVDAELKHARELLAAARPTQVRQQGPTLREGEDDGDGGDGGDGEGKGKGKKLSTGDSVTDEFLQEARFKPEELDDLYAGIFNR